MVNYYNVLPVAGALLSLCTLVIPTKTFANDIQASVAYNPVVYRASFREAQKIQPYAQRANYQNNYAAPQAQNYQANNVWQRVLRGYRLGDHSRNPEVQRFIAQYTRNPSYMNNLLQRASQYMHIIIEEVERRNIPAEIALLPLVESAFKPAAESHAGAAGLWQFMPATGHEFGLIRNRIYDARLDSFAATGAALSYLQSLSREFNGDWMLALASYNAGPGRVRRAISAYQRKVRNDRQPSYWRLSLPRETDEYVPRLLAFKEILNNPAAYGVTIPNTPNVPMLAQMRINKPVDLRAVAHIAGLQTEALTQLNPYFKIGVTTPEYSNRIILPRKHAPKLVQIINDIPPAYYGRLASR